MVEGVLEEVEYGTRGCLVVKVLLWDQIKCPYIVGVLNTEFAVFRLDFIGCPQNGGNKEFGSRTSVLNQCGECAMHLSVRPQ